MQIRKLGLLLIVALIVVVSMACGGTDGNGGDGGSGGQEVKIVNRSPYDVCDVFISEHESESWGGNDLDGRLGADETATINVDEGTYDILVRDCDQRVLETVWETSGDVSITIGREGEARLLVDNFLDQQICYLYVSPENSDQWGVDRLGDQEVIKEDEGRVFFVEPGTYDLRAENCDEEMLAEEYGVDITDEINWEIYP